MIVNSEHGMDKPTPKSVPRWNPFRISLRTLLILMLLAGPTGAWGWNRWQAYQESLRQAAAKTEAAKLAAERANAARNVDILIQRLIADGGVTGGLRGIDSRNGRPSEDASDGEK